MTSKQPFTRQRVTRTKADRQVPSPKIVEPIGPRQYLDRRTGVEYEVVWDGDRRHPYLSKLSRWGLLLLAVTVAGCAPAARDLLVIGHHGADRIPAGWEPRDRALHACTDPKVKTLETGRKYVVLKCAENLYVSVDLLTRREATRGEYYDTRFLPR